MKRIASLLIDVMLMCSAFVVNASASEINNVLGDQSDPATFPSPSHLQAKSLKIPKKISLYFNQTIC